MSQQMPGTTMFVGWKNSSGKCIVSQRHAAGHTLPAFDSDQSGFSQVKPSNATANIAFSIVLNSTLSSLVLQSTEFIFASSSSPPNNIDLASSAFSYHDSRGAFTLDATAQQASAIAQIEKTASSSTSAAITTKTSAQPRTTALPQTSSATPTPAEISSNGVFCVDDSNIFCINGTRKFSQNSIVFSVQSTLQGWVGFGIGSSMGMSTIFVGWNNSTNMPIISQRDGAAYVQPPVSQNQVFKQVVVENPSAGITEYALELPTSMISLSGPTNLIFGGSNQKPTNIDSIDSNFAMHDIWGTFQLDLSHNGTSTGLATSGTVPLLIIIHGVCMALAWIICPTFAIFIARYLKFRLGHLWYKLHVSFMFGMCSIFMAAALVCVELFEKQAGRQAFSGTSRHAGLGITLVFVIYPVQVGLGVFANYMFEPNRISVPWWDTMHAWIGRIAFLVALATVFLGVQLAGLGIAFYAAFGIVVVAIVCVFSTSEAILGPSRHLFNPDADGRDRKLQHF
ncbi:hypothetical protein HDU84_001415 [Entophlyctis sp. JEL0112]|nr:hypothetical protein HDU84_001415 [Entophlyctis sp. JEL0112]